MASKRSSGERVPSRRRRGEVALERALSKLGIASRSGARAAILAGRVAVAGRIVRDPGTPVVPERAAITIDGERPRAAPWRALVLHKPAGVITTRDDPHGRTTVFDWLGEEGKGLLAVGRLDRDTTGLLILTSDSRLADWLTDPANAIPRLYRARVRGAVEAAALRRLEAGIEDRGQLLRAERAELVAASARESCLLLTLAEGKNREVRRLLAAIGHPVRRLERLSFGGLALGELPAGAHRELSAEELRRAFGAAAPIARGPVRAGAG